MEYIQIIELPKETSRRMLQCDSSLLRQLFQYHRFGEIDNYIGKEYLFYQYDLGEKNICGVKRRRKNFYHELSAEHGFKFEMKDFGTSKEAWEYLRETLQEGILNILYLDTYYVPFCPLYQSEHATHCFCVNGMSDNNQTVTIYDISYNVFNKEIAMDVTERAWQAKNYLIVSILQPDEIREVDFDSFKRILQTNYKNMLEPDIDYIFAENTTIIRQENYQKNKVGLQAIFDFASIFEGLLTFENHTKLLRRLYLTVSDVAEETELHAFFIKNMFDKFELQNGDEIFDEIKYIAQEWMLLKNMLLKASFKDTKNILEKCTSKVQSIGARERSIMERINTTI